MNRPRLFLLLATSVFVVSTLFAVPIAKWESPEVTLGAAKAKVLETLGKPDTTDTGTEMYLISDSPDLLMGMVEYKNDKVSVNGQIYKPNITLKDLKDKMTKQGLTPLSENEEAIVYFTKMPTSDLEYYIVLSPTTEATTGPGLAKMTKEAFAEAEQQEKEEKAGEGTKPQGDKPDTGAAPAPAAPEKPKN